MSKDRWQWLTPVQTLLRSLAGFGVLGWELIVDRLHHWPPTFVLALWLLGGPVEALLTFLTAGRLQIQVKPPDKDDEQ